MLIRDAEPGDGTEWRRLWAAYCHFYDAAVPEAVTEATWARILDPASTIICRLAAGDDRIAGFATAVIHPTTWTIAPACYLEDLYVDETARGTGLGRALIEDLFALARARDWSRVYWHTRAGNADARRLYDRFAAADDFVRYRIALGDRP